MRNEPPFLVAWRASQEQWYHGSPHSDLAEDFSNYRSPYAHFTKDQKVARDYATKSIVGAQRIGTISKKPTVYTCHVNIGTMFDMRIPEHQKIYDEIQQGDKNKQADPDERLPKRSTEGFIQRSGLPGYGYAHLIMQHIHPKFHSMLVDEGTQGQSLLVHDPQQHARVTSRKHVS